MPNPEAGRSGVVTPEAVLLEFDTAGIASRTAAAIADIAIRFLVYLAVVLAVATLGDAVTGPLPSWVGVTLLILFSFVVLVGYSVLFEAFWSGRTPGKAMLGMRVVTVEGAPIHFRHAAIRGALGMVEILATWGIVALIVVACTRRSQRLGDLVAGTLVLRERSAGTMPRATTFTPPQEAQEFAMTLDVSIMTTDDYLAVRSYLTRMSSLEPGARSALAGQLAQTLAVRFHAMPPEWMSADEFLVCVAAAYQRRFSRS